MALDALLSVTLDGHVESIAPASGVSFATVASENATGYFTKITQRLAVQIAIEPNQKAMKQLHMGMSVSLEDDIWRARRWRTAPCEAVRTRTLVADLSLDKHILWDVLSKKL